VTRVFCSLGSNMGDARANLTFGVTELSILLFGNEVHDSDTLTVPHPRMWERAFVLAPLADLAPELVPIGLLEAADGEVAKIGML